jgi:hypothetical protein
MATFEKLISLAKAGATVIFEDQLPKDVPGLADLERQRTAFKGLLARSESFKDRILVGNLESCLKSAWVPRETLFDHPGLMCVRRRVRVGDSDSEFYFVANRGDKTVDGLIPLATEAQSVVMLDPLTGRAGVAASAANAGGSPAVFLQLAPGESVVLHAFDLRRVKGPAWNYRNKAGEAATLEGKWQVKFIQGGPELPAPFTSDRLASWTELGDTNAQRFAGSALYSLTFDAPAGDAKEWQLDLGKVCQSARVKLNGRDLGTLITPPFRVVVNNLKAKGNRLEVEVTNVSANRIRDLDRRGVKWKTFNDINFVNLDYRPFDASNWPLTDSGLLGPVTLTPVKSVSNF